MKIITKRILNPAYLLITTFHLWQVHRTDSSYENSLTVKMYLFQFVNFYASIFYIAFFKGRYALFLDVFEPCEQSGCLTELCINLAIVMGGSVAANIVEVSVP